MPMSPLPTLTHTHLALSHPHFSIRPDDLFTPPHLHTHPHSPMLTSRCRVHTPPSDQMICSSHPTYTPTHTHPHSPRVIASHFSIRPGDLARGILTSPFVFRHAHSTTFLNPGAVGPCLSRPFSMHPSRPHLRTSHLLPSPSHHVLDSSKFPSLLHLADMCAHARARACAWHSHLHPCSATPLELPRIWGPPLLALRICVRTHARVLARGIPISPRNSLPSLACFFDAAVHASFHWVRPTSLIVPSERIGPVLCYSFLPEPLTVPPYAFANNFLMCLSLVTLHHPSLDLPPSLSWPRGIGDHFVASNK